MRGKPTFEMLNHTRRKKSGRKKMRKRVVEVNCGGAVTCVNVREINHHKGVWSTIELEDNHGLLYVPEPILLLTPFEVKIRIKKAPKTRAKDAHVKAVSV